MDQNRLQQKRRKRQAKRKDAQARARRRIIAEDRARDNGSVPYSLPGKQVQSPTAPGFFGKLFGGVPVAPDQMDTEAAPIVSGEHS